MILQIETSSSQKRSEMSSTFDPIICSWNETLSRSSYQVTGKNYKTIFFGINCTMLAYLTEVISKVLNLKCAKKCGDIDLKKYSLVIRISD